MKKSHKYGHFRIEKFHKYRYFRTEELHKNEYSIIKNLDEDIQNKHGFHIFYNCQQADIGVDGLHT